MPGSSTYQTHPEIKAQLKAMLSAADASGEVMDAWGQVPTWLRKRRTAQTAWYSIRRTSVSEEWGNAVNDFEGSETVHTSTYEVEMKYPFTLDEPNDYANPSEVTFEALVDAVLTYFRNNINLDGAVWRASLLEMTSGQTGFVAVQVGDRSVVCHLARFTLTIQQFASRS